MIWLQSIPWAKWLSVGVLVAFALWLEVRPAPVVDHPFASVEIAVGELIGPHNTQAKSVPVGLFEPPPDGSYATSPVPAGAPILVEQTGDERFVVPAGWWIVSVDIPVGSQVGDRVRLVMLDSGQAVDGIISSIGSSDGFSTSSGGIAVEPGMATEVAAEAANGRVAVLVATR